MDILKVILIFVMQGTLAHCNIYASSNWEWWVITFCYIIYACLY